MKANKKALDFAGKYKWLTIVSCILASISSILSIVPFVCIYKIIQNFISTNPIEKNVIYYGKIAVISAVISIIIYFLALTLSHICAFRVAKNMKKYALLHIIDLPMGYFEMKSTGELRKIIDENTMLTEDFLAHQLPDFAAAFVMPIVIVICFFVFDWRLGVVCLIPLFISLFCIHKMMGGENKNMMGKIMTTQEKMNKEAVEYIRGIPVVKVFQQTVFSFKKFYNSICEYRDLVGDYAISCRVPKTSFNVALNSFFVFLMITGILIFNISESKIIVFSNLIFFVMISPLISSTMMRLMMTGENFLQTKEAVKRINNILDEDTLEESHEACMFPKNCRIEFKNVSFHYPESNQQVLKDINLDIEEGSKIAIVGSSGSGKSTLATLIARFFDVDEGEILIGGLNIKCIKKKDLMQKISFVFQNSKLFETSIIENVKIGNKEASKKDVITALKAAQCGNIIEKFSDGAESIYGTKGIYLSGGEKQRIALARAFLKDSPLIIFDEATASTDAENEYYITKAIEKISENKTVIMIAHRLQTVMNMDKIVVMDKGMIVEEGTHQKLLQLNGKYSKMWFEYVESKDWRI